MVYLIFYILGYIICIWCYELFCLLVYFMICINSDIVILLVCDVMFIIIIVYYYIVYICIICFNMWDIEWVILVFMYFFKNIDFFK